MGRVLVGAAPCYDSRRVEPGSLYVALAGRHDDGHRYLGHAAQRGAVAVLVDRPVRDLPGGVCVVVVPDTRVALSQVAARWYGEPGRALQVVAVTGTNGKTSVCCLVEGIWRALGVRAGVIGNAGLRVADQAIEVATSTPNTPEAVELQQILRIMIDRGAGAVALEASSMALQSHRVDHCFIDVGVFTNLTPDHLDDHGTMEAYRQAKLQLFLGRCRQAVLNADDPTCIEASVLMPAETVSTYGFGSADFRATDVRVDAAGSRFTVSHQGRRYAAQISTPGRFAVSNALAAVAACYRLGDGVEAVVGALETVAGAPGRCQLLQAPSGALVVIDYAHSADALTKVLETVRQLVSGRVVTVFGCGGDRDHSKRAPMGEVAATYSDLVVLTSDNPRGEDPHAIMDQIAVGAAVGAGTCVQVADRAAAIGYALDAVGGGDAVVIAGKGSERHQVFADRTVAFNDEEVVRRLLAGSDTWRPPSQRPPSSS